MTSIQVLFTLGLAATWLVVVFPMVVRDRDATVHGSAAGFERAMSVLQQDTHHVTTTTAPAPTVADSSVQPAEVANAGPIARERPTSLRAARRPISSDEQLSRLRQVFVGSLVAVFLTAGAAIAWQGPFWTLFVVVTLATGGFVSVLRHRKLESDRAKAVIRSIRRDSRTFVGRDQPHAFEALPPMIAATADRRHYGGLHDRPTGNVHAQ